MDGHRSPISGYNDLRELHEAVTGKIQLGYQENVLYQECDQALEQAAKGSGQSSELAAVQKKSAQSS